MHCCKGLISGFHCHREDKSTLADSGILKNMASSAAPRQRIALIDLARGAALLAMTVFHFIWDLAVFRLVDPSLMASSGMIWFARSIAGSFLFLVGVSLYLAHGESIKWQKFTRRLAVIALAALAITIATMFATPDAYIFFGILHSIAIASVFGLAFLRFPWWLLLCVGIFFLFGRVWLEADFFAQPWLWWTGLATTVPLSNDFVPVFPFFGMVLAGIATTKLLNTYEFSPIPAEFYLGGKLADGLQFIGRHSLIYYLLHQPIMLALLAAFLWFTGHI
jgi:uncharacterized membrane protein